MQVGLQSNESYLSQAATLAAVLVKKVPKKPLVVVLSALAGGVAYAVTNTDSMAVKGVSVLATGLGTGYAAHRVYELAADRFAHKVLLPALCKALQNHFENTQAGNAAQTTQAVENKEAAEPPSSLSGNGVIPQSVQEQLAYKNSSNVKQTMIRLIGARAYINSLGSEDEKKAVAKEVMAKVFDGVTSQERALELLSTQKGTKLNKARLEDLAIGSRHLPKNALTSLDKSARFVDKKDLHKFLQALIELAK